VNTVRRSARSDYDGYQIGTKLELGKTINLNDFRFTPSLGLSYSRVEIDKYTETRATTSNLTVNDQSYDILNNTLKAKVARTWQVNGLDLTPEVHVGYSYEYLHQKIQATSNFGTAATNFTSIGFSPANHTYLGGLGMTYKGVTFDGKDALAGLPPVDFTLTYDFAAKDHFMSHSALLKGTWRF
jgi:outer membrane autotransporter protein